MSDILDTSASDSDPTQVHTAIPPWKRALDLTCIFLSLPVMLPLSVVIAGGILLISPGPVLFPQDRVGRRGQRFKCLKFRSMRIGSDTGVHKDHATELIHSPKPWAKMDDTDPRMIPLGKLLRATGLDELPQLLNVVRGEMSLVGPRPCTLYEFTQYLPWQKERFNGLPGLTGLWQVSGKHKKTFTEMVKLDIQYLREASVWLDLKIMLKTVPTLVGQVVGMFSKSQCGLIDQLKTLQ